MENPRLGYGDTRSISTQNYSKADRLASPAYTDAFRRGLAYAILASEEPEVYVAIAAEAGIDEVVPEEGGKVAMALGHTAINPHRELQAA